MQVAVQRVPVGSLVLGIDLVPIAPIRGAVAIQQDITKSECRSRIKKLMEEHGVAAFDLVLHDGSPNVGGAWAQEAMSQNALVIDSVRLATQFLAPKANFVTKVIFFFRFLNWVLGFYLFYKNGAALFVFVVLYFGFLVKFLLNWVLGFDEFLCCLW